MDTYEDIQVKARELSLSIQEQQLEMRRSSNGLENRIPLTVLFETKNSEDDYIGNSCTTADQDYEEIWLDNNEEEAEPQNLISDICDDSFEDANESDFANFWSDNNDQESPVNSYL